MGSARFPWGVAVVDRHRPGAAAVVDRPPAWVVDGDGRAAAGCVITRPCRKTVADHGKLSMGSARFPWGVGPGMRRRRHQVAATHAQRARPRPHTSRRPPPAVPGLRASRPSNTPEDGVTGPSTPAARRRAGPPATGSRRRGGTSRTANGPPRQRRDGAEVGDDVDGHDLEALVVRRGADERSSDASHPVDRAAAGDP